MSVAPSPDIVQAIVTGLWPDPYPKADPFAVLGMHVEAGAGVVVRSFQPDAESVEVLDAASGRRVATLERIDAAGLFAGTVARRKNPFAYRLRVRYAGTVVELDDPYRHASSLGELDLHLLGEGRHWRAFEALGAHCLRLAGSDGVRFAVWAPNARRVSVVGDFNRWDGRRHPMRFHPGSGCW